MARRESLDTYREKRDFEDSPEPRGRRGRRKAGALSFVVQKHSASHLHHDFRLELDGVLLSWAVPKGPPAAKGGKSLAVRTEDHPLAYGSFEGVIPAGSYGAGTVMLWDRGTWEPEDDPRVGLAEGRLAFRLDGERLRGRWALVRMRERRKGAARGRVEGAEWLLLRRSEPEGGARAARSGPGEERSIASGRTMDEIAEEEGAGGKGGTRRHKTKRTKSTRRGEQAKSATRAPAFDPAAAARLTRARAHQQPKRLKPQLARLADAPPAGERWLHEMKLDGYRLLAFLDHGEVRLRTRNDKDWTDRSPTLVRALAALPLDRAILDGEVVVLDRNGVSQFQALQNSLEAKRSEAHVYFAFDLPHCAGQDLTACPLVERKELLARLLGAAPAGGPLRFSDHVVGDGGLFLRHACELGLEGIVSKRVDAPYEERRSGSWLKTKCLQRQELVVGGWSDPAGARAHLGALLLGVYDGSGALRFAGRVGTGFSESSLAELAGRLAPLGAGEPPFVDPPTGVEARGVHWVRPELVAEVSFTEWTADGHLRHPSFHGLREDKRPEDVVRERADRTEGGGEAERGAGSRRPRGKKSYAAKAPRVEESGPVVAGVRLSNPGRVLWPEQGLTKRELALYYATIAERILPHVVDRPLTLLRCPRGRAEKCFYQKHVTESVPAPVRAIRVQESGGPADYVGISDLAGLVTLVQLGVLELHPWGSRADRLDRPDRVVLDLDPGPGVDWGRVVHAARRLRDLTGELGLTAYVRTTGGKGLHVVLPIARRSTWSEVKEFARDLATALAREDRSGYVLTAAKAERKGRIFLDYLRNDRGSTAVASYSARARENAPVAMPVAWSALTERLDPRDFTVRSVPRRVARGADPWKGFFDQRQSLTRAVREGVKRL